jgi:4-amino-4-deoxy-L-arabinose transferase-like glycosyltransferase
MASLRFYLFLCIAGALVVYLVGAALIDVMDIDSSHYAEMSREIKETGDYLQIKNRTLDDYLDKPPLLFWISSLFYSIFGVSTFTFRLPAILISFLGAYSVFRFIKLFHDRDTGLIAAVVLLTSQSYFLYHHNILTDTLLANLTIFSIWQLSAYLKNRKWYYFLGAFTGMALGMLAKGPLGLMVPIAGFSVHFIVKRQWRNFIRWEWLAGAILILVILSPMVIGLYGQYGDLGVQFFFWTQSFGRLTGQSHWYDQSSPFYFVHTFAWFMLPWTIFAIIGLIKNTRAMFTKPGKSTSFPEAISAGGFLISFLALSLSKYKLPQYIFVLIPLAAAFTAPVIRDSLHLFTDSTRVRWYKFSVYFFSGLYLILALSVLIFVFPRHSLTSWILLIAGLLIIFIFIYHRRFIGIRTILPLAFSAIIVNLILNLHFYPNLLMYQPGIQIAKEWNTRADGSANLYCYHYHSPALDFHLGFAPPILNERKVNRMAEEGREFWLVTDENGLQSLDDSIIGTKIDFKAFPIQALSLKFLDNRTRQQVIHRNYLVKIIKSGRDVFQ